MVLIKQIALYLQSQSVGTLGTDLFYSYNPDTSSLPIVAVIDTGGIQPSKDVPTKHPTFQVFIRAADYVTGKTKLDAVRSALHQTRNQVLAGGGDTYFYYIFALSEGGHIGRNEAGMDEFSINFEALIR